MRAELCDHPFVVRSYYRRVRPGALRRHVRWCHRCVDCHEYIGGGPIPSKPPRVSWKQKRAQKRRQRQLAADVRLIEADFANSGKEWDDYWEELRELDWGVPFDPPEDDDGDDADA